MRATIVFFLAIFIGGCVESQIPLSPYAPLAPDHPLIGTWVHRDNKETVFLHIGNQENGLKLLEVEFDDKGKIKSDSYVASSTALAGNEYLSIQIVDKGRTSYYIWKYQVSGKDTLTLWPPDYDFVAESVKKGLIAGVVNPKPLFSTVQLSADQQALQRFVAEHDGKMFPKPTSTMKRLP